ncbi:hypothetical protein ABIE91_007901 [Bradyrhizobium elkanii]
MGVIVSLSMSLRPEDERAARAPTADPGFFWPSVARMKRSEIRDRSCQRGEPGFRCAPSGLQAACHAVELPRRKSNPFAPPATNHPDGQISKTCQSRDKKIFRLDPTQMFLSGILNHSHARVMTPRVGHLELRLIPIVVPAKAGTHNHKCRLLHDADTTSPVHNIRRGVWVPAFAGTTACLGHPPGNPAKFAIAGCLIFRQ